jgi:crossover junction endodeoxyribonuclease RuvC
MSEFRIGVDPGLSGCVVAMFGSEYVDHLQMPVIKTGKSGRVDAFEVACWIQGVCDYVAESRNHYSKPVVFVEIVGSMPGQGVSTTFAFGRAVGAIEAVFMAKGCPVELVAPQSWKKRAGMPKGEKDGARSKCVMLYPDIKDLRLKGKGQALGDAIMIALYGSK